VAGCEQCRLLVSVRPYQPAKPAPAGLINPEINQRTLRVPISHDEKILHVVKTFSPYKYRDIYPRKSFIRADLVL